MISSPSPPFFPALFWRQDAFFAVAAPITSGKLSYQPLVSTSRSGFGTGELQLEHTALVNPDIGL